MKAIVIYPFLKISASKQTDMRTPECRLQEAVTLCKAIDVAVCHSEIIALRKIDSATILTTGKLEELHESVLLHEADVLIVDSAVSPSQQRNLEKKLNIKVLDRIGLILEIFGQRAATKEGHLQVEHARLSYQKSRLVKAWSHLERQRGGGGFTGGPGETQKESDRRMIDDAIKRIEKKLESVVKTRDLHRKSRKKVPYPIIALAGYTNAGKSTLFNKLTDADVLEADMLFATLDPTLRTVKLPSNDKIILSDTVGFVSDLPTQLVKAFRATLEEVNQADIILHVRDIAHPETDIQKQDVLSVLSELGLDKNILIVEIFNKIDILLADDDGDAHLQRMVSYNELHNIPTLSCSALTGQGIDEIRLWIQNYLNKNKTYYHITFTSDDAESLAAFYRTTHIIQRDDKENGDVVLKVQMNAHHYGVLKKQYPQLEF